MSAPSYYLQGRDASIVLYSLPASVATIALLLRGISRYKARAAFGWDDFFAVAAVCFFWAESAVGLWSTLSKSPDRSPASVLNQTIIALKGLYINTLLTVCVLSAAKLSILCLYKRIFSVNRTFRIAVNILIAVSSAWWVGCFILAIFRCIPVAAAWQPALMHGAKCYSLQEAFLITEIINCVTEALMIILPISMVRRLHLPTQQRIAIALIFAAGFFVTIASIVRIVLVYSPSAGSVGLIKSGLWGTIQMCTAICTACLPTYRRLLQKDWHIISTVRDWYSLLTGSQRSRDSGSGSDGEYPNHHDNVSLMSTKPFQMTPPRFDQSNHVYETKAVGGMLDREHRSSLPTNAISVEHSVTVA